MFVTLNELISNPVNIVYIEIKELKRHDVYESRCYCVASSGANIL